jgi:ABC-type multidrug transport system ATPase subunit
LFIENAFGYIDQLDKHAPRLTVEETFEFAFQCKSGGKFYRDAERLQTEEAKAALQRAENSKLATKLILAGLGLTEVKDTYVGDSTVRGVSGGQRRRVTVGEMFISGSPVLCGDEISTGLDAASTYDMIQMISYFGRLRKFTRVISLLQPSPETVSLFDEVILLADGQILYSGPVTEVEDYFARLGYEAPEFMDCADFLQMISSDEGKSLYDPPEEIRNVQPDAPTISELAEKFRNSRLGRQVSDTVTSPPSYVWEDGDSRRNSPEVSCLAMTKAVKEQYANNFFRSTVLILKRFLILWIRDKRVIGAGAVKNILMGVSVGGVFFDTKDPISIEGALFQAGLFVMLGTLSNEEYSFLSRV